MKITFAGSDGVEKTLYYFSTNLANDGFRISGFEKFVASLAPGDSFIKSASYLLYKSDFSHVRSFLLNNSATLVQDDSGIPLAYFNREELGIPSVRQLSRTDLGISRPLSGKRRGIVQEKPADRFRRRLSLAAA